MTEPLDRQEGTEDDSRNEGAGFLENGKMVDFAVKAWDEAGPIGAGTHTRAIIKNEKFLARCSAKLEK